MAEANLVASAGAKQVVNELLNAGAQVDATNSKGQTALCVLHVHLVELIDKALRCF